jgi:hypothetical protein
MSGTKAAGVALAIVGVAAYSFCKYQEGQQGQQGRQGQQGQQGQRAGGKQQQLHGRAAGQAGDEGGDEGRPLLQPAPQGR